MPPVPAKRYPIFQTAFELKVAEAQVEIASLDLLQGLYTAAREALLAVNLPNDIKISLDGKYRSVDITVPVVDGDTISTFRPLLDEIGNALVQRRLHSDGQPAQRDWDRVDKTYCWRMSAPDGKRPLCLNLSLNVPWEGTNTIEIKITTEERQTFDTTREAIWHDRPWKRPDGPVEQS